MAWIEAHQELERHPKVFDLMARMGWDVDTAIGKLFRFWWWCVDYAEDGDLRRHNDERLAGAVGLNGDMGKRFVQAMVESCWIDREPYFRVHDWWDYFGLYLQSKYRRSPKKWQVIRDSYKESNNSCNPSCNDYCTTTPDLTVPNQNIPPGARARESPPQAEPFGNIIGGSLVTADQRRNAVTAFDQWSSLKPPVGRSSPIRETNNEHNKIASMLEVVAQSPPIIYGGKQVPQHLMVPQVIEHLKANLREFRDINYAVKTVRSELERWAMSGLPGSLRNGSPGPLRKPVRERSAAAAPGREDN